jgi:hypothetical protein
MKITVFSDVTPYSVVDLYQSFEGTCYLHIQGAWVEAARSSEPSVNIYQTTRRHIVEDGNLHFLSFPPTPRTRTFLLLSVRSEVTVN